jgi:hypothetical protein
MTNEQYRPVQNSFERFVDFAWKYKSPTDDKEPQADRNSSRARDVKSEIENPKSEI